MYLARYLLIGPTGRVLFAGSLARALTRLGDSRTPYGSRVQDTATPGLAGVVVQKS